MARKDEPAIAPMLKIAPIANPPPKMSRRQIIPMNVLNHTALTGVLVRVFTCFKKLEKGKQSSRAYAKATLEAAIMHAWPMANPAIIVRDRIARATSMGRHCVR